MPNAASFPRLRDGERMDAREFHRRYEIMQDVKKAELFHGEVFLYPADGRYSLGSARLHLIGSLGIYHMLTGGVGCGARSTVKLDAMNEAQPDAIAFIPENRAGRSTLDADGFIVGGPELVCEVVENGHSRGLAEKRRVYEEFGVPEFVVWRVDDKVIEWFVLRQGRYVVLEADADAIHRSRIFPGLWIDEQAMLGDDLARVFAALQQGCATPEHAEFVKRLNP